MADRAQVQGLLAEVGPLLELAEVTAFEAESLWTLVVDEATVLFLDYEDNQARLWLPADVATPPETERTRLYEMLLTYNHRWQDTGGLRMLLAEPAGMVVLSYDLSAERLEPARLSAVLRDFINILRAWREGIAGMTGGSSAGEPFNPMLAGIIRG